ncbi:MAG: hemolysin III family protein [Burkholderiales bacterium]|nr:hemolysin III family protein [Burkholderiales bacterium]
MPPLPRAHSAREEHANAVSHALGLLAAVLVLAMLASDLAAPLLALAREHQRLGLWVFGITMGLCFAASALFHACADGPWRRALRRADHAAIYLFMAGSYTPFALRDVPGGDGWLVFGAVWALATLGMAAKLLDRLRGKLLSTALYVGFGWVVVAAARPVLAGLPPQPLALVVGGALAYSVGTVFYLLDKHWRWGHLAWHLCVLAGSGCHAAAVVLLLR